MATAVVVARLLALVAWLAVFAVEVLARTAEGLDRVLGDAFGVAPYAGRVEAWLIPPGSPWNPEGARRG